MPGILPLESEIADDRVAYSFVDLASGDASTVISTLASTNARRILTELNEQPGTASALADSVGTSIQNVLYHLTSLQEAELVEHVDTWYSCRGVEMKVYAPVSRSLVLFAGTSEGFDDSKRALAEKSDSTVPRKDAH